MAACIQLTCVTGPGNANITLLKSPKIACLWALTGQGCVSSQLEVKFEDKGSWEEWFLAKKEQWNIIIGVESKEEELMVDPSVSCS